MNDNKIKIIINVKDTLQETMLDAFQQTNIIDIEKVKEFINKYPDNINLLYSYENSKLHLFIIKCDCCLNFFGHPYSIFYHCNECLSGEYDICYECSLTGEIHKHRGHILMLNSLFYIYNTYYKK